MRLSPRQQQVFDMIGQGIPNRDIARSLKISPRTTEVHRLHIMRRLGLKSTTEIVKLWVWCQINGASGDWESQLKNILGVKS
jgi:DNA-binding CsgD family transcriptional regulator